MSLYSLIKDPLKAISWMKWVDIDAGQLEGAEKRKVLIFPCSLIAESSVSNDITESGDVQREDATLTLRLAWDATGSRTNASSPETVQERSLAYTVQTKEVYELLQGAIFGDYTSLECGSAVQEKNTDGLVVFKFTFKTNQIVIK